MIINMLSKTGYIESEYDSRDYILGCPESFKLPESCDYSDMISNVKNQGNTMKCVPYSLSYVLELAHKLNGEEIKIDIDKIYRAREGFLHRNNGSSIIRINQDKTVEIYKDLNVASGKIKCNRNNLAEAVCTNKPYPYKTALCPCEHNAKTVWKDQFPSLASNVLRKSMQRLTSSRPVGSKPSLSITIPSPISMAFLRTSSTGANPLPTDLPRGLLSGSEKSCAIPSLRWIMRIRSLYCSITSTARSPALYTQKVSISNKTRVFSASTSSAICPSLFGRNSCQ